MFKKLLSNLPFNPSLIGQVSFYTKRMKQESAIRRAGVLFLVLAMLVQFFAVISPPQSSLASSDNDIVRGGFTSQQNAVDNCLGNTQNFRTILEYYGLSCDSLRAATPGPLNSIAYNKDLHSLGRNPVADSHPKTGKAADQEDVIIPGVPDTLHMKNLWYWDSRESSTYQALEMRNKSGVQMWVLMDCGNVVIHGHYSPPQAPPPELPPPPVVPPQVLSCTAMGMSVPDDSKVVLGRQIIVRGQAGGQNIKAGQKVDMYYDYVDATTNKVITSSSATGIGFSGNTATDSQNHTFTANTPGQFTIRLTVKYDGSKVAAGSASGKCVKHISVQKICDKSSDGKDLQNCIERHKTVQNVTGNKADANKTTANGGDTIKYTLTVSNGANVTVPKFVIEENISDVLDYADVVDLDGGTQSASHIVTWPGVDLRSKQVIRKNMTFKIKNPVPSTPVSTSDGGHFDCWITNFYGDSTAVKINCPVAKTVETTTTLPNTGPGESLAIGFVITALAGYFFARSRLFATELDIVRQEYTTAGGI